MVRQLLIYIVFLLLSQYGMAQVVTDPSVTNPGYDAAKQAMAGRNFRNNTSQQSRANANTMAAESCFIPRDSSYTPVPRNDDGSFGPVQLPFTYSLYGTGYTQVWINTNGNITFTGPYSAFNASGFPIDVPMVAAFWADVDTRNTSGGQIYYKLDSTKLVVTWDAVGYFNFSVDKLNTFQIVLTGPNGLLADSSNTAFYYQDMQWTTGSASGSNNGFGGTPATVGVNRGNLLHYFQVGRFNLAGLAYDGPGGANDGVDYLDDKCFLFNVLTESQNVPPSASGLPPGNQVTLNVGDSANLQLQFIGPEVGQIVTTQVDTQGLCRVTFTVTNGVLSQVNMSIRGDTCNIGTHVIGFTASDNGTPQRQTIIPLTVVVNKLNQVVSFNPPSQIPANGILDLAATASSGLPVSFQVLSGPGVVSGNRLFVQGVGTIVVRAIQPGNNIYNQAVKDVSFCVAPFTQAVITGPVQACINKTTTYIANTIPGADFHWSLSGGGTLEQNGSGATVSWTSLGTHVISVRYTANCGDTSNTASFNVNVINTPFTGSFMNLLPANGSTDVTLPINFSWLPLPGAIAYDLYVWADSLDQPSLPLAVNINTFNYLLGPNNFMQAGQKYKWRVVAKGTCNDISSPIQVFTLRHLPDLIVTSIQLPASGFSGQSFSVQWQVRNNGLGGTQNRQWLDRIYLSTDAILDNQDITLGTVQNVSELQPGGSYVNAATFTLPQGINNNYYAIVVTNAYFQVSETDVSNNRLVSTTTSAIQLTPPPDLQVTSIVPPNFAFSGQDINVSWQIRNVGPGQSVASSWLDRVYFSKDTQLNVSNALLLGSFSHNGILQPSQGYNRSATFTLPDGIFGRYFVYVITDVHNQVYEHAFENNNTKRSDSVTVILTPPIDLVVPEVTMPASAGNRESVVINWKVQNAGGSATGDRTWSDDVYISKAAVFNPDSVLLLGNIVRRNALAPGDEYAQQATFTIPDIAAGQYYVYVKTDAGNRIYEHSFENNNIGRSAQRISIASPDLIVSAVNIPAADSSGRNINISWTIKNAGTAKIYNTAIADRISISTSATFSLSNNTELKVVNYFTGDIAADSSLTKQATVTLPNGIAGNYFIYVQTDFNNNIFETSNTNNTGRSASPIAIALSPSPDMQVTSVLVPDTATAGDIIPLTYKVTNRGRKAVSGITWLDKAYLSLSPQFNAAASTFVRDMAQARTVQRDSSYEVNTTVKIPASFADTSYYAYIYTDSENAIYEHTDEGNNTGRSNKIFVKKYPPVDLAVISISAPDSGSSGNPIRIKWTVENKGQAITLQNQWNDALFLSSDTIWDNNDRFVKEFTHRGELAAGSTYADDQNFILPNGISGNYYLLLVTDRNDVNRDVNRSNNYKLVRQSSGGPTPIVIVFTRPPDLVVSSFSSPNEGTAGQPVLVKWTVKNMGPGRTAGNVWTEKIYLSTNLELDGNDPSIGSYVRNGGLDSGASYTDSMLAFLPINANGNYAVIFKTDANDNIYEHGAETNTETGFITITQAPLSDLVVSNITVPEQVSVGETITVQWKLRNIGANPASGYLQQGIYLSTDTTKDVADILLGSPPEFINLAPQAERTFSFAVELKGVALRNYYALVHTVILNNISETSDSNNVSASLQTTSVSIPQLPLNVLTHKNLPPNKEVYYRIEIPDSLAGESLLITLQGDSAHGRNEMFVRFDEVPTRAVYDFAFNEPYAPNQEIIIPELAPGTYYLMVYGSALPPALQPVSLLATILNFELRSVDAVKGGNTGSVTLLIKGSKLGGVNSVRLKNAGRTIIADSIKIVDPTKLFATFNLRGVPLGLYDVNAQNNQGDTAVLHDAFTVVAGSNEGLITNVVAPPSTRPSNVISLKVEFRNAGNVDLINPVLKLTSLSGAPIAFTVEDLVANKKELTLVLQELNGPVGILRPGASGTVIVYAKALTPLGFMLIK